MCETPRAGLGLDLYRFRFGHQMSISFKDKPVWSLPVVGLRSSIPSAVLIVIPNGDGQGLHSDVDRLIFDISLLEQKAICEITELSTN